MWAVVSEAALWTAAAIACDSWQLASSRRSANTPASPLGTRQRLFHDQEYQLPLCCDLSALHDHTCMVPMTGEQLAVAQVTCHKSGRGTIVPAP